MYDNLNDQAFQMIKIKSVETICKTWYRAYVILVEAYQ